jgi:ABC-2 type transport system ATP-binding protein
MITIQDLTMSYGNHTILKNINIEFDEGKVYGIVGKNGAGKTSLFRCIAGLEKYDGIINSSYNPLKNHLGLLLTEPFFFEKITGKEYIQLLCNARKTPINDIESRNVFDLPLNQYATTYSTGIVALESICIKQLFSCIPLSSRVSRLAASSGFSPISPPPQNLRLVAASK